MPPLAVCLPRVWLPTFDHLIVADGASSAVPLVKLGVRPDLEVALAGGADGMGCTDCTGCTRTRSAGRRTGSHIRHHPYVRPSFTSRRRGAILARSDDEDEVDGPAKNKATGKNEEKVKEEAEIQKKGGEMQKEWDKNQEEGDEIQKVSP
jgi:hypothetical protein